VQLLLKMRSPAVTAPRITSGPTLLTGICFCAACGMAMTLRTGKGGRYRYYTRERKNPEDGLLILLTRKNGCSGKGNAESAAHGSQPMAAKLTNVAPECPFSFHEQVSPNCKLARVHNTIQIIWRH
jgi:hypothetical protein